MISKGFKETEIGWIPKDWNIDNLEKYVVTIFCGRDPRGGKKSHSTEPTDYRIIQSAPVFDGYLSREKLGYVKEDIYFNLESASLKENDVLLNQLGDGITFARSCVVPKDVLPAIITRSVGCIRCDEKVLDPWFLNAYFVLPRTKKYIESFNSGSSRRAIDGGKMRSFIIPIPPLNEQKKIGQFYKLIQDKIELNNEMNRTLETIGQAIFQHWFVHFEFPNSAGLPYKSSGGEMVDSEFGEIPKGWEIAKLEDHMDFLEGPGIRNWQYTDEGIPFINIRLINNGEIDVSKANFVSVNEIKKYNHFLLKEKDLIVSTSGTLGRHAIVRKEHLPLLLNTSVIRFRPKSLDYSYMYYYLTSKMFYEELLVHASGSVQLNFGPMHLKRIFFILPPVKIQNEFEAINSQILEKLNQNRSEIFVLSNIRDSLLPKLMSGKIRVNIPEEATVK